MPTHPLEKAPEVLWGVLSFSENQQTGASMDLKYVESFLERVSREADTPKVPEFSGWWRRDEGHLQLTREAQREYLEVRSELMRQWAKKEDISEKEIGNLLVSAIFEVVDLPGKRHGTRAERIPLAIKELRRALKEDPIEYQCFVPVGGLDCSELPQLFGKVRFVVFNKSQLRKFVQAAGHHTVQRKEKQDGLRKLMPESTLWNKPCASLKIDARDRVAAVRLARRETTLTLDAINFLGDLIPYNDGWLHLPEEAARVRLSHPVLGKNYEFSEGGGWKGPFSDFSFTKLRDSKIAWRAATNIKRLLRGDWEKTMGGLLLTAVQWAGRASVEPRRERAFLYFMIALESVFLLERGSELRYRLGLRLTHWLGRDHTQRGKLRNIFKKLYEIRSSIVHDGSFSLTDDESSQARHFTKIALLRLLSRPSLWKKKEKKSGKHKEWQEWLEKLVI